MRPLVVLPTYNEAENLGPLVRAILAQGPYDVLIVDDASPDGTGAVAEALRAAQPDRVAVLHRPGKLGLGTAYLAGFKQALADGYDAVFEMDADFSHRPEDLQRLLVALESADVAIGSRYAPGGSTPGWPLRRRLLSQWGARYTRLVLGLPLHDPTSGFKCLRREALAALDLDAIRSTGYAFQIELHFRCFQQGLRLVEVPIVFADRRRGTSKMSLPILWEAIGLVWRLRREAMVGPPAGRGCATSATGCGPAAGRQDADER